VRSRASPNKSVEPAGDVVHGIQRPPTEGDVFDGHQSPAGSDRLVRRRASIHCYNAHIRVGEETKAVAGSPLNGRLT